MTIIAEVTALIALMLALAKMSVDRRQSRQLARLEERLQSIEALAVDPDAKANVARRYRGEEALRAQPVPMDWEHEGSTSVIADQLGMGSTHPSGLHWSHSMSSGTAEPYRTQQGLRVKVLRQSIGDLRALIGRGPH